MTTNNSQTVQTINLSINVKTSLCLQERIHTVLQIKRKQLPAICCRDRLVNTGRITLWETEQLNNTLSSAAPHSFYTPQHPCRTHLFLDGWIQRADCQLLPRLPSIKSTVPLALSLSITAMAVFRFNIRFHYFRNKESAAMTPFGHFAPWLPRFSAFSNNRLISQFPLNRGEHTKKSLPDDAVQNNTIHNLRSTLPFKVFVVWCAKPYHW